MFKIFRGENWEWLERDLNAWIQETGASVVCMTQIQDNMGTLWVTVYYTLGKGKKSS